MTAPLRKPNDNREFKFDGDEAKEPNAAQRMHHRGWPVSAIAEFFRCTVASVRHDLAMPGSST